MGGVSQKSVARYGTPIGCSVTLEVAVAPIAEGRRCKRSTGHIAAEVLCYS